MSPLSISDTTFQGVYVWINIYYAAYQQNQNCRISQLSCSYQNLERVEHIAAKPRNIASVDFRNMTHIENSAVALNKFTEDEAEINATFGL